METSQRPTYAFGPYVLDRTEWRLRLGEKVIDLPPKAFAVLNLLVEKAGTLVLKDEILATVWKDTFVEEGNVAFYVAALRRALDEPPGTVYIETVKTRGYRFVAPVAITRDDPSNVAGTDPIVGVVSPPEDGAVQPVSASRVPSQWRFVAVAALAISAGILFGWAALFRDNKTIESVVVVPFHAIATDSDQAYLESGIAEAIAMRLGDIKTLRVPPLAAVRQNEGPFEAGRRLGTEAVLTGTVQKAADRLQVSVQLSRVTEGSQLWSWTFDTKAGEILNVEREIAERIAARLRTNLTEAERGRLARRDTVSGEAYDFFLQAHEQWKLRTPNNIKVAIGLFEKAIQIDPQFARAYAGLANCYNLTLSGLPAKERYPLAKANAEKAIALDPQSVEGHTSLAFLRYKFEWQWPDADAEFKRAIAIDPRYALSHHWYGEFLGLMGRTDEGIAELQQALLLDPQSLAIRTDLAIPLLRAKRLTEARAVLESGHQLDTNWHWYHFRMSDILAMEGHERESVESLWRGMILRGASMSEIEELREGYTKGRMAGMIRAQIRQYMSQEVKPTSPTSIEVASNLSYLYGRLGDREQAFHWLDIAIDRHEDAVIHLLTDPAYDSLRDDPRFTRLLERFNLNPPGPIEPIDVHRSKSLHDCIDNIDHNDIA